MSSIEALKKAVRIAGGQSRLAAMIGGRVRQQHVSYWLTREYIPAEHVLAIERATGGEVTRGQLRPDLYPEPFAVQPQERAA